ncbi:MAG: tetratricopeptide repeat protein [Bacteroidales bacterium]|nr:tetratricopeptide repeat protein [Bacteroidales bacterium]
MFYFLKTLVKLKLPNVMTYPINIIPKGISDAKNCNIPVPGNPQKPTKPLSFKRKWLGFILLGFVITAVLLYKFTPVPENAWVNGFLTIAFVISSVISIFNHISNRFQTLAFKKEQENYEFQMRQYNESLAKIDEINRKNNDPIALSAFRKQKVKEALMITDCSLKPIDNTDGNFFESFYHFLLDYFPGQILINYSIDSQKLYSPNYIVAVSNIKLYIDIEIDTPYSFETSQPDAYFDDNNKFSKQDHNNFFSNAGWVVIRFAEEQIIKYPESCCKNIAQVIFDITEDNAFLQKFNTIDTLAEMNSWTLKDCEILKNEKYRESYLFNNKEFDVNTENDCENENNIDENNNENCSENEIDNNDVNFTEHNEDEVNENEIVEIQQNKIEQNIEKEQNDNNSTKIETYKIDDNIEYPENHNNSEVKILHIQTDNMAEINKNENKMNETSINNENEIINNEIEIGVIEQEDKQISIPKYQQIIFDNPEAENQKNIVELVAKMNECHNLEQWNLLLEYCNKVLAIDPTFQLAYMRRSTAYGNLGKLDKAIEDCKAVININPENPDAYYNSGIANLMLKRYRNAIEDFQNAIKYKIQHIDEVYFTLSGIYSKLDDEQNYNKYLQLSANAGNQTAKTLIIRQQQKDGKNAENEFKGYNTRNIKISEGISDIAYSMNDEYCAIADQSRKLRVYKTSDWQIVFKQDVSITSMAFSRNNKFLAIGGHSFLRILNVDNNGFSLFADIINYTGSIKKMFFHPFNNDTLFVSDNFSLYKVDIKSKVINKTISDFQVMAVTRDMQYVAGKDYFSNIKIYRINVLSEIFRLNIDASTIVKSMSINSDATRLIYGDNEGKIHVYNPQLPAKIAVAELKSEIIDIKISCNSVFFSVLTSDRKLRFFNTTSANKGNEISMKYLPKLITMSNVKNMLTIGDFNENVDIIYVDEVVTKTVSDAVTRTA